MKKLSLKCNEKRQKKIVRSLKNNKSLEKLSLTLIYSSIDFFNVNDSLKVLKLPRFIFNTDQANNFIKYLENSKILEELHLCDDINHFYKKFTNALLKIKSLKIIYLIPGIYNYGLDFKIFKELLSAIPNTSINDFSSVINLHFNKTNCLDYKNLDIFLSLLDCFFY